MGGMTDDGQPTYRIAVGGLASENCTFSPCPTGEEDFVPLDAAGIRERCPFLTSIEAQEPVAFVHGFFAKALPGGPIGNDDYLRLRRSLLDAIEGLLPLDAVYLDLHGAMLADGRQDIEADLVTRVRELVGNACLIGASMDLHGNVSPALVEQVDLFSAYRTAPHEDEEATREKVCRLLVDTLKKGHRPDRIRVAVPVLLPGEKTSTQVEPGKGVYEALAHYDGEEGILDVSLWVGYVWADEPRATASVVVTGTDPDRAAVIATEVARRYWEARTDFAFGTTDGPMVDCLEAALKESETPVLISDSGDNPTAGGAGNRNEALRVVATRGILRDGKKTALIAGLWDPTSVEACFRGGEKGPVSLRIGNGIEKPAADPVRLEGEVVRLIDEDPVGGRMAVFQSGGITAILTERRKPFHTLDEFRRLGIDPAEPDLIVVKMGYLVPELYELARASYLALTPGAVDQNITRLPFVHQQRPMFPFDPEMEWAPGIEHFAPIASDRRDPV
ncbi:MAG: M81 family metallopeptidase [Verrucomicrobiota bacterium]